MKRGMDMRMIQVAVVLIALAAMNSGSSQTTISRTPRGEPTVVPDSAKVQGLKIGSEKMDPPKVELRLSDEAVLEHMNSHAEINKKLCVQSKNILPHLQDPYVDGIRLSPMSGEIKMENGKIRLEFLNIVSDSWYQPWM